MTRRRTWTGCVIYGGGTVGHAEREPRQDIVFDDEATHTKTAHGLEYDLTPLGLPLTHPSLPRVKMLLVFERCHRIVYSKGSLTSGITGETRAAGKLRLP